jgi:hypothetical protein
MLDQQLQNPRIRQAAALLVGRAHLQRRHDLAPALDFHRRHHARLPAIRPVRVLRTALAPQQPVQGRARDRVQAGRRLQQHLALRVGDDLGIGARIGHALGCGHRCLGLLLDCHTYLSLCSLNSRG